MAKILVICNFLVPPVVAGSCKCVDAYIQLLKELGHEVFILYSGRESEKRIEIAKAYWGKSFFYYKYSNFLRLLNWLKRNLIHRFTGRYSIGYYYPVYGLSRYVNKLHHGNHFDAVIVNYIWMTPLLKHISIKNKILFTHDSFTNKRERIKQELYSLTPKQETCGLNRADTLLSIQETESVLFRFLVPDKPVYTVYMPIDFHKQTVEHYHIILFFSGDSELNQNGLKYFLDKVFDSVVSKNPSVKLLIGGGICKSLKINNSHVELLGFVDNVDAFYSLGNIVINPVYQGTGLKIKTMEAISYGKVTIVHPHSVEGLFDKEHAPVCVASTPREFVDYIDNALNGCIDMEQHASVCEDYINKMNNFIYSQYRNVKFD